MMLMLLLTLTCEAACISLKGLSFLPARVNKIIIMQKSDRRFYIQNGNYSTRHAGHFKWYHFNIHLNDDFYPNFNLDFNLYHDFNYNFNLYHDFNYNFNLYHDFNFNLYHDFNFNLYHDFNFNLYHDFNYNFNHNNSFSIRLKL
ncbi:Hypothetical predicted protein [Cloeon dipterum]|uniref:Uncharacterized protein n=1 Tax=Cloeon dipterum TaxID=197152 RepID=A0A8S1BSQ7_9INSE|nr:Hypothetical predicted protein [Cloeon dipterum]